MKYSPKVKKNSQLKTVGSPKCKWLYDGYMMAALGNETFKTLFSPNLNNKTTLVAL